MRHTWMIAAAGGLFGCSALLGKSGPKDDLPDQGMTSDTHEKHVGEVVFSPAEIPFQHESPASFRGRFRLGEPIYARAYVARSLAREVLALAEDASSFEGGIGYEAKVSIDGKPVDALIAQVDNDWTTWSFAISSAPDDARVSIEGAWFTQKVMPAVHEGANRVRIEVRAVDAHLHRSKPIAVGTFRLEAGSDRESIVAAMSERNAKVVAAAQKQAKADKQRAEAETQQHYAAGDRWVNFSIVFCEGNPTFELRMPDGSSANSASGGASWLPRGTRVYVCTGETSCPSSDQAPFAVVQDSPNEQRIEYDCR